MFSGAGEAIAEERCEEEGEGYERLLLQKVSDREEENSERLSGMSDKSDSTDGDEGTELSGELEPAAAMWWKAMVKGRAGGEA